MGDVLLSQYWTQREVRDMKAEPEVPGYTSLRGARLPYTSAARVLALMQVGAYPAKIPGVNDVNDSDPFPEPVFVHTSGEHTSMGTMDKEQGRMQRPPTERVTRNSGNLAHITQNRLNLEEVLAMDPEYLEPLRALMSEARFLEGHLDPDNAHRMKKRISRFMAQHDKSMRDMGITETVPTGSVGFHSYMPVFTTLKKSGELRLIQDCRCLNAVYERPPSMDLPKIHDVIAMILGASYVAQADAVSYFYQFPMAETVRPYFAARLCAGRGLFTDVRFTSLPMGFSHAPAFGQRTANVLIRGCGGAWVDNFFVIGDTMEKFSEHRTTFLERTHKVNLELDDETLAPTTQTVALGIEFDLVLKRYRMEPAWVEKAVKRLEAITTQAQMSVTDLYVYGGTLTWRNHIMRRQLCNIPHTFQAIGKAASMVGRGTLGWTSPVHIPEDLKAEMRTEIALLASNPWRGQETRAEPTATMWSDASDDHWAFLLFEHDTLVAAKSGRTKEENHIYYSELSAALGGIMAAKRLGHTSVRVMVDNAPACHALQRGVSSNFRANKWLAAIQDMTLEVIWVPSASQLADPYTRGVKGRNPPRVPMLGTRWETLTRKPKTKALDAEGITQL